MLLPLSGSPTCVLTAVEAGLGGRAATVGLAPTDGGVEAAVRVVDDGTGVTGALAGSGDGLAPTEAGAGAVTNGEAASPGVPDVAGASVGVAVDEPAATDAVPTAPAEHAQASRPQPTSATSQRARAGGSWLMGRMRWSSIVA